MFDFREIGYIAVSLIFGLVPTVVASLVVDFFKQRRFESRIERAESRSEKEPQKATPVWDVARLSLERYLDRNLSQLRWVFIAIVIMVSVGFGIIIEGILIVYSDPTRLAPAVIASASGIITQFIGASLLLIYRSVLGQAKEYVTVLERINAVGMSMQVLDAIEGDNTEVRDKARIDIALTLLRSYHQVASEPGTRSPSRKG
jgi:hypothetical protein